MFRSGTWRIEFKGIGRFRYRLFDDSSYPWQPAGVTAEVWEIFNSRWLRETRHPGPRPEDLRHYVITSTEVAYEIAALIWTAEPVAATAANLEQ
jgi:hypothetical protein